MPFQLRKTMGSAINAFSISTWDKFGDAYNLLAHDNYNIIHLGDKAHKTGRRLQIINSIDELYKNLVCEWPNPDELVIDDINSLNYNEIMLLDESLPRNGMDSSEARMMYWDVISYMTDDILCKVDRAAMGTSLETRVPFLDHRVAEIAWQIPTNMKIKNGQGKWPLREILYKRVPQELIERPKAGFGIPLDDWLRGPMKTWAEKLIDIDRLSNEGFLNPEIVHEIWNQHIEGKRNWSFRLWSILMFQSWLEQLSN
jgi:asparagine synthase (glutamine-hydrolysing)